MMSIEEKSGSKRRFEAPNLHSLKHFIEYNDRKAKNDGINFISINCMLIVQFLYMKNGFKNISDSVQDIQNGAIVTSQ